MRTSASQGLLSNTEALPEASRRSVELESMLHADGLTVHGFRNLQIASWTAQGTIALVELLAEHSTRFHRRHPEGVSVVHVISKGPALPDAPTRERLKTLLEGNTKTLACVAIILDGRGFWASAVRSFLVGLRLVSPRTFVMQVFSTPEEVAAWLPEQHLQRTGVRIDAPDLLQAIEAVRTQSSTQ
ncbi:MAG TPA: hypothetical protein VHC69_08645 [Polyangiaceae bacterium]|nr:hypothetical protein [Polyangiaceae bacterium]